MIKEKSNWNVLIVVPSDDLGGAEQYLKMVAQFFSKKGLRVLVLCIKRKQFNGWTGLRTDHNITIKYGNHGSELKGFYQLWMSIKAIRNNHFTYTFSSHVHVTGVIGLLRRRGKLNTKYLIGRESTSIFRRFTGIKLWIFKYLYKIGYPQVNLLICQTDFMKKQLVEALPKLAQTINIKVIANPLNLADIEKQSKQDIDVSPFGEYLVAAGRLIHLKGYDLLIKALGRLNEPALNLVILGKGSEEETLKELIAGEHLQERVFLQGQVANVFPYFKNAKCCVVSSRIEGFPNVLLQMMSQNHKVVSTRCAGGIEDIPGIFTCKTNDVEALTNALQIALKKDTTAHRYIFDDFLRERTIDKFINNVEELVAEESPK